MYKGAVFFSAVQMYGPDLWVGVACEVPDRCVMGMWESKRLDSKRESSLTWCLPYMVVMITSCYRALSCLLFLWGTNGRLLRRALVRITLLTAVVLVCTALLAVALVGVYESLLV